MRRQDLLLSAFILSVVSVHGVPGAIGAEGPDGLAVLCNTDPTTYGYEWNAQLVTRTTSPAGDMVRLPEYYRLRNAGGKSNGLLQQLPKFRPRRD